MFLISNRLYLNLYRTHVILYNRDCREKEVLPDKMPGNFLFSCFYCSSKLLGFYNKYSSLEKLFRRSLEMY